MTEADAVAAVFREEYGRAVSVVLRMTRDLGLAERRDGELQRVNDHLERFGTHVVEIPTPG